jgi:hypothetical protein
MSPAGISYHGREPTPRSSRRRDDVVVRSRSARRSAPMGLEQPLGDLDRRSTPAQNSAARRQHLARLRRPPRRGEAARRPVPTTTRAAFRRSGDATPRNRPRPPPGQRPSVRDTCRHRPPPGQPPGARRDSISLISGSTGSAVARRRRVDGEHRRAVRRGSEYLLTSRPSRPDASSTSQHASPSWRAPARPNERSGPPGSGSRTPTPTTAALRPARRAERASVRVAQTAVSP